MNKKNSRWIHNLEQQSLNEIIAYLHNQHTSTDITYSAGNTLFQIL